MAGIEVFFRFALFAIPIGFGIILLTSFLRTPNLSGLVRTEDGAFSPARAQLLVVSLTTGGTFLTDVIATPDRASMPDLTFLAVATLGSEAAYLAAKANRLRRLGTLARSWLR